MLVKGASFALACVMLAVATLSADILVWDNDNWKTFSDPEGAGYVGCEYRIVKALEGNGHTPQVVSALPADLTTHEAIFIVLGWC